MLQFHWDALFQLPTPPFQVALLGCCPRAGGAKAPASKIANQAEPDKFRVRGLSREENAHGYRTGVRPMTSADAYSCACAFIRIRQR